MPTINEMLAQPTEFGFIGGQRKKQEDVRTQETHEVDTSAKRLAIKEKQAQFEEYLEGKTLRKKQRKVQEQQADRDIASKDLLDEQQAVNIENAIQQASSQLHSSQIEELGRTIGAISNQKNYDTFLSTLDEGEMQLLGFEPSGDFKQDKSALRYIQTQAIINMEHQRALEMQALKNQGTINSSQERKYTPGSMELYQPADEPMVRSRLTQDPYFDALWKSRNPFKADATAAQSSVELLSASDAVMSRANEIVTERDDFARKYNDPTLRVGKETAYRQALYEYKVMSHKKESGQIIPMDKAEYARMLYRYSATLAQQIELRKPEEWKRLSPEQRQKEIYNAVFRLRQVEYENAQRELSYGK